MSRKKRKPKSLSERLQAIKKAGLSERSVLRTREEEGLEMLPVGDRVQLIVELLKKATNKTAGEMVVFIMYDISDDKVRKEVAKYLIKKGCVRVQKSVFLSQLNPAVFQEIYTDLKEVQSYYENEDSIMFVPVSENEFQKLRLVGQSFDFELLLGRKNTLII